MQPCPAPPSIIQREETPFLSRLLRLPPELTQNILDYVLSDSGISGVVRLRLVSRSFYGMIDGAVFTGNYFRDQIHIRGRKLSQSYLAKFLISKVVQDERRKSPLSQLIDGAVDVALGYSLDSILNKEKLRDDFTVVLCRAMAFFLETQALDIYDDVHVDVSFPEKRKAAVIGAAAMGQTGLLCQMMPTTSDDSQYFGPLLGVAALNGHAATTDELLRCGLPVDLLGLLTTLQAACIGGNDQIILRLLDFQSDTQKLSYEYQSAIMLAVEYSHWQAALCLFENTTIPDTTSLKQSMFCSAAKVGCSEIINAMINKGVDIYCRDPRHVERNAYEQAASKGHIHILKLLVARGFDPARCAAAGHFYPGQYAIQGGHLAVLRFLMPEIDGVEVHWSACIPDLGRQLLWIFQIAEKFNQGHIAAFIRERHLEKLPEAARIAIEEYESKKEKNDDLDFQISCLKKMLKRRFIP